MKRIFFSRVHATLQPALSVGRLVGWSVGRLVGRSVTLYFFLWFYFFDLTALSQMFWWPQKWPPPTRTRLRWPCIRPCSSSSSRYLSSSSFLLLFFPLFLLLPYFSFLFFFFYLFLFFFPPFLLPIWVLSLSLRVFSLWVMYIHSVCHLEQGRLHNFVTSSCVGFSCRHISAPHNF